MRIHGILLLAVVTMATAAAGVIFDFESVSPATTTPFVHPGSVTANFSSPDGAVFSVADVSFLATLSGQALLDSDPARHALSIVFSSAVLSLNFNFALASDVPSESDQLTWIASSGGFGGTIVGTGTVSGSIPLGFGFPEGLVTISGITFDSLRITATSQDFAVDNLAVEVAPSGVPEPSTAILCGISILMAVCGGKLDVRRRSKTG